MTAIASAAKMIFVIVTSVLRVAKSWDVMDQVQRLSLPSDKLNSVEELYPTFTG